MTAAVLARAWVRVFMFRDMVWLGLMMIVIVELFFDDRGGGDDN